MPRYVLTKPTRVQTRSMKELIDEANRSLPPKGQEVSYELGRRVFRQGELSGAYAPAGIQFDDPPVVEITPSPLTL